MPAVETTQQSFEQDVLNSDLPVLVDLYADWCGPCKQMAPILDDIADEYESSLKVVKIDIEANPAIAQAFRVQSIPMLVLMQDGQPVDMIQGALPKQQLVDRIGTVVDLSAGGGGVQTWEVKSAAQKLKEKSVRPVDLRAENDYGRARLPGAVNAPPERFDAVMNRLRSSKKTLLLYSRDSADITEQANRAAAAGLKVAILKGGLLGWEADGKPVEKGAPTVELL